MSIVALRSIRSHSDAPPVTPRVCSSPEMDTRRPLMSSAASLDPALPKVPAAAASQRRLTVATSRSVARPLASITYPPAEPFDDQEAACKAWPRIDPDQERAKTRATAQRGIASPLT